MSDLKAESSKKNQNIIELMDAVQQLKIERKTVTNLQKQCDEQNKQINNLKNELLKKDQTITALTKDTQQLKIKIEQHNAELKNKMNSRVSELQKKFDSHTKKFEQHKQAITIKLEKQTTNIQQLKLRMTMTVVVMMIVMMTMAMMKNQEKKRQHIISFNTCENMFSFIKNSYLKNGEDFLLVSENKQFVQLKNNEWNNYKFGIFLIGKNITLTADCKRPYEKEEFGYLKIKTSHLWIKHSSSRIACSELGYPENQGPGKGGVGKSGNCGGGYGTNGEGQGIGGRVYGKEALLKEIHFGSGGGSQRYLSGGSGGGIIELIIEQQLTNHGSIQSNGGDGGISGGGGSGGSILIKFEHQSNTLRQTFGIITCIGGKQYGSSKGGKGRIAIYGINYLSPDNIKYINPIPFY
ncbi:hypothetical protein RFI_31853 [Reticulomyxa filosa]|uniref:Uncharacterized protein n=1 Tax=Reticulomyxa filosa TaxID=46433 RepID=X6LVA4_RETFI|nr:hypothetical protein RFI_31853 [Reticulomyxa filosa]|eukprot:ETO05544.1 hypothetical protein RFI_31853 [Reticulomyxa filosa]